MSDEPRALDEPAAEAPRGRRRRGRALLGLALGLATPVLLLLTWGGAGADRATSPALGLAELPAAGVAAARNWVVGPATVGVQVGHLGAADHPEELARLRASTGGKAAGLDELDVNRAVAAALAERLRAAGVRVDLLPATVPPGYRADVLLSLHADASPDPRRRGYKSAHFQPARNGREPNLKAAVDAAYLRASGLPSDARNVTVNMYRYYAFNARRYRHAAHRGTAGLLVEMGYLSNPADRAWLQGPEAVASALAEGVLNHLAERRRIRP